jgi:hypothetical protein
MKRDDSGERCSFPPEQDAKRDALKDFCVLDGVD